MRSNIGQTIQEASVQEGSRPPWAVMPLEEKEEHNIATRQWKMSARST